jgi:hypothetical protein
MREIANLLTSIFQAIASIGKIARKYDIAHTAETNAATSKNVTVTSTATLLADLNVSRACLIIVNDAAQDMSVFFADSVLASSQPSLVLTAGGGTLVCGAATDIPYLGKVWGTVNTSVVIRVSEISPS